MQSILAAILGLLVAAIYADDNGSISTSAQSDSPPDWANNNALQLNLSSDPIQYTVVPVLPNAGTNGSNSSGIQVRLLSNKAYLFRP
jgi:hypothetical protein